MLSKLLQDGGFPEPYHRESERELRRWHQQRLDRWIRIDLRDLENVKDLEISPKTVKYWLAILAKCEIDFVVIKDKKPLFAVECKTGEAAVSPHIYYFRDRTTIPKFYQIHLGKTPRQMDDRISVLPFESFCKEVHLV